MRKPDFFIVGGPRCGTTALYTYLREHPAVFMPHMKECHFFADDFAAFRRVDGLQSYLDLFQGSGAQHTVVGEASVYYFMSSVAIENIYRFAPSAKIILIVRNPVDMLHSLHQVLVKSLHEDVDDFEEAWRLQPERKRGLRIPASCRLPACLQYAQVGTFGAHLQRMLRIFPKGQVHVVVFDDFVKDTRQVYESTLEFLGVAPGGRCHFPRIGGSTFDTLRPIQILRARAHARLWEVKKALLKWLGEANFYRLLRIYGALLTSKEERLPLSCEFRANLVERFRDDILLLSGIIKRDLSPWLTVGERVAPVESLADRRGKGAPGRFPRGSTVAAVAIAEPASPARGAGQSAPIA